MDTLERCGLRGKRTRIVELYTSPPAGATVVCADELGPVIPRTFPPAPGWSPDGHHIKNEIDYSRGLEKTWVYGALRVRDGHEVTMTATSRNSAFYQQFLQLVEDANPAGDIYGITDSVLVGAGVGQVHGHRFDARPLGGRGPYQRVSFGSDAGLGQDVTRSCIRPGRYQLGELLSMLSACNTRQLHRTLSRP
ncbi:hypothetical protein ACH41H_29070 [Streptomyces sp. NPDC020800]|uniref:hypothetical protein n=1 Tax=Streptomyces sp. NPDC020800 TaxID=3365092 RepID=UPI003799F54B